MIRKAAFMPKLLLPLALCLTALASPALAQDMDGAPPAIPNMPQPDNSAANMQMGQKLGECMVAKVSAADKPVLAQWVAVEISASPLLAGIVTVDAAKRAEFDKAAAQVFTRLVTLDCLDIAKPLLKADSRTAFRASGATIGRIAIRELMASPGVNAGLVRSYLANLDQEQFRALMK